MSLTNILKETYKSIHNKIYDFKVVKELPSKWIEKNIYLTSDVSSFTGYFKYDITPYTREVVDCLSPSSPVEMVAVMKCAQSGFTQGVIIPGIAYIISETPAPILYTAADADLVKLSIRTRLDPVIEKSGLQHLIRANVIKKKNSRSGDTDFSKEFAGGSLTALGVNNPAKWRQYSVKYVFADDWEAAPRSDKKEGNTRSLIENRATSYGSLKKLFYISTPLIKQGSNTEEVFLLGDQRKWNWKCDHCNEFVPMEWQIKKEDGSYAGVKWELDSMNNLIESSVHYECQNCGGKMYEKDKMRHNRSGKWVPTAIPLRPTYRSYQLNALVIPPGFTSWVDLVYKWLDACPPNQPIDTSKLKSFANTQLGQTWEDKGKSIRVSELMNNTRTYNIGVIPDKTSIEDGNGPIVLITLACDLGGVMIDNNEDVRLDWEIVAHSANGQTYNINHGSIGTFKKTRQKKGDEKVDDSSRIKWTYSHGQRNSVWAELDKIIESNLIGESGDAYNVKLTVIDTGHFTKLAYKYIDQKNNPLIVGIKGDKEKPHLYNSDKVRVKRSVENGGKLYLIEVGSYKDLLSYNMNLKMGVDGFQPSGFMNYPMPELGKYSMRGYFSHLESEHRVPVEKDGIEIGFIWKKKNSSVENHFFDVNVYNLAAKDIFIDIIRKTGGSEYSQLTWEKFIEMIT